MLGLIILYALFAAFCALSKQLLLYSPPFFIAASRVLGSGALLLVFYRIMHKQWSPLISRAAAYKLFLYGFMLSCVSVNILCWSLQCMSATKVIFFYAFSPFITAVICYFLFAERLTLKKILGSCIGFASLVMMIAGHESAGGCISVYTGSLARFADVFLFFGVMCYCYGWIIGKELIEEHRIDPSFINGVSMIGAGIVSLFISMGVEGVLPVTVWGPFFGWLSLLVAICALCYNLYLILLNYYSPTYIACASFLEPVFGALYEWILFGVQPTLSVLCAIIGIFGGLYIFHYDDLHTPIDKK